MAVIISVSNRKGGTGKTTTVVNLAAELSSRGYKVLVIDLDSQAHASLGLGFSTSIIYNPVHLLFSNPIFDFNSAVYPTRWNGLFLAPASPSFEHGNSVKDNGLLREALSRSGVLRVFDFIVIDTPPSLDALLLNALTASNFLLIPFLPHFLSAEGIISLARTFLRVVISDNPSLKLLGFVPIMVNARIQHHRSILKRIADEYGKEKILPQIRMDIKLVEAFESKSPIRFYAPRSKGALDYKSLTDEVLMIVSQRAY